MSEELDAIKRVKWKLEDEGILGEEYELCAVIEKALKESDKIKARLTVVKMKLASKREECVENMKHTDEDDFVHEASKIMVDCIDWFKALLNEVED